VTRASLQTISRLHWNLCVGSWLRKAVAWGGEGVGAADGGCGKAVQCMVCFEVVRIEVGTKLLLDAWLVAICLKAMKIDVVMLQSWICWYIHRAVDANSGCDHAALLSQ